MGRPNGYAYLFQKKVTGGENHVAGEINLWSGQVTAICGVTCKQPVLVLNDVEDCCTCNECRQDCGMKPFL
jgi:hypothetical protein